MRDTIELVKTLYRTQDGKPFELADGQADIFDIIFKRKKNRVHIMTPTQYGKSDTVSMAVLTRVSTYPEKYTIVGPSQKKARIIINYAISHIFDNPYTLQRFQIGPEESLERIRRERSKNRLTFKTDEGGIGEFLVLSGEAHRQKEFEKALMGFGSPNVIEDESALIPDPIHATVLRMLGGQKDNLLVKVGNPLKRNHFLRSFRDPKYYKIKIDYHQAIREGRFTTEFIEEMRKEMTPELFRMFYEVEFPDEEMIDLEGYSALISERTLDNSYVDEVQIYGQLRLGIDVAGGGRNKTVMVLRGENGGRVVFKENISDTMVVVGEALKIIDSKKIDPHNVFVDVVGIGKGVFDRLREQRIGINGVNFGKQPEFKEDFVNLRAQSYWRVKRWLETGAKLEKDPGFEELLNIKYKVMSDKVLKLKPKAEMLKEGISSPDTADALALTFSKTRNVSQVQTIRPHWQGYGKIKR